MTRSRKKRPAGGVTAATSDKLDKKRAHRRTRRVTNATLARGDEPICDIRLTENPWSYAKDGKRWYGPGDPRLLRK